MEGKNYLYTERKNVNVGSAAGLPLDSGSIEVSEMLYELLWRPIVRHLKDLSTVSNDVVYQMKNLPPAGKALCGYCDRASKRQIDRALASTDGRRRNSWTQLVFVAPRPKNRLLLAAPG